MSNAAEQTRRRKQQSEWQVPCEWQQSEWQVACKCSVCCNTCKHWHIVGSKYHNFSETALEGHRTCRDCSISAFSSASLFARSACISLLSSTCFDIVRLEIWSPCGALKMPSGSCDKHGRSRSDFVVQKVSLQ